jgi:hypothetical protein
MWVARWQRADSFEGCSKKLDDTGWWRRLKWLTREMGQKYGMKECKGGIRWAAMKAKPEKKKGGKYSVWQMEILGVFCLCTPVVNR